MFHRIPSGYQWGLLVILLVGAFLRWAALRPMSDMLHYDEAYNGADALSLLHSPRLTPFLPGNYGRESAWCYLLVPFVAVFGAYPIALRLAAAMTGVLTLAASYRLGKEVLGARGAIWVPAACSVLYWHVHLSHLALRAGLFPLVGTLAFASLLRARRTNALSHWIASGLGVGFLAYTYFAAYLWIVYALVLLAWWLIADRERRRGAGVTLLIAAIVFLPMALYALSHPEQVLSRPKDVGVLSLDGTWNNLRLWVNAWFRQGDLNAEFNLPGRPILDPYLGMLFVAGIVGLPFVLKRRWYGLWIVGLAFVSVLPSLLSNAAPHFLRACGLMLPTVLVAGAGAWAVERVARRVIHNVAPIVPLVLLIVTGVTAYRDFHLGWLRHPEVFAFMEQHLVRAISFVRERVPDDMPVYFSPLSADHPILRFQGAQMQPRHVGAFDSHSCLVVSDVPAVYVSLTVFDPGFQQNLAQWADMTVLAQDQPEFPISPRYTIFRAAPRPSSLVEGEGVIVFGDAVRLRSLRPISSTASGGTTIPIVLGMGALHPLDRTYNVFVHLYGDPTPYEGGRLWGQGDAQICASYPTPSWNPGETVIQRFDLPVPVDVPPGRYVVATGVFEFPAGARLPVTAPTPQRWDYSPLQEVEITAGGS